MTYTQRLTRLTRVGCYSAANDLRRSSHHTLADVRWRHHITIAINNGFVSHVEALLEVSEVSLTQRQADRLTNRCLSLGWNVDAVGATRLGAISASVRNRVIRALIASGLVDSKQEAIEALEEQKHAPSE